LLPLFPTTSPRASSGPSSSNYNASWIFYVISFFWFNLDFVLEYFIGIVVECCSWKGLINVLLKLNIELLLNNFLLYFNQLYEKLLYSLPS
jgi:hypothetical protein